MSGGVEAVGVGLLGQGGSRSSWWEGKVQLPRAGMPGHGVARSTLPKRNWRPAARKVALNVRSQTRGGVGTECTGGWDGAGAAVGVSSCIYHSPPEAGGLLWAALSKPLPHARSSTFTPPA